MKKTLLALAAAATVGITSVATPTAANAQWRHGWGWGHHGFGWGAPVAAGVIGGLAAGAVIGSAFGAPYYYGGYPYGAYAYDVAPVGYAAPVTYGYAAAPCALRSERFWNGYGWTIRRVRVCY